MRTITEPGANMRTPARGSCRRFLGAVAVAAALAALAAARSACAVPPEIPTAYTPGASAGRTVTLLDAIDLALRHDPTIRRAQQTTLLQKGSVRQAAGVFDLAGIVQPSVQLSTSFLSFNQRKGQEQLRDLRRQAANELQRVADNLDQQIKQGNPSVIPPVCQGTIIYTQDPITGENAALCIPASLAAEEQLWTNLANNFGETALGQALQNDQLQRAIQERDAFWSIALSLRNSLRNMGTVPRTDTVTTFSLNLAVRQPFRNGAVFMPSVLMSAVNDNFDGKPPNQQYGGKGLSDTVTSAVGFEFDVPLGRGRGAVSADAPERSARFQLQASLENEAFAVSSSVLSTELAYWRLVGAQDTLAVLERSRETEEKLLELGRALVEGDQIARSDLAYLQARVANTRGSVAQARQAVVQARVNLAIAMGLAVHALDDAPLASDAFPPVPAPDAVDRLNPGEVADTAIANRSDLASSRRLVDSADVIVAAARADLKRRVDLSFAAGYRGLDQSGFVTHWGDYWSSTWNSVSDFRAGPSALISIDFSWPFKNNVARGRYAQARSLALKSGIQSDDLRRVIGANTTRLVGSLRRAVREIGEAQAAVEFYQQSLASETERFKLGESTAVDLLLTEDNQLSQLLALVSARQAFATLLTQLRFEAGALVGYSIRDDAVRVEDLRPLGLELPRRSAK